ncbi:alpha-N-arabinofuranosidase [Actinoplanes ianthinogenes]|uniref:Alpha-N-arabinofuranosidase n=1 Tax=Actinoplanes ianthinogenes TaxID=122358 RepID=A0ABN6CRM4_9ACTN|nr:glycoside hydrolase family 43 protein [Actinoplanes ianthinogenes]BCJ47893.1 alpha-N-arabinofuranosidase [Actinoplanes ianthinogenes]GGR04885.1 alpha-N-arabinofuranosidase [Actinoplanes ianthinogenes]
MTIAEPATAGDPGAARRTIRNPVLPGFHPDPSIVRVGADYYIATSTFEWFPGVRVHHSTDLVDWRPLGGVLTERRLLDLTGTADSCGVWAPNLTYAHGLFHLLYTDVATFAGGYWDPQNYLITAPRITGPWSDPVVLHGRGFDASLFHDEDGTTWMLSMRADWRPGRNRFAGISLQRYDRDERRLTGPEHLIFEGTEAGLTEAPNIYRKDGWYYLVTAEGGTTLTHQVTVARSRELLGPYRVDPAGPLLTSAGRPDLALQKAGHGSLVQTPDGEWYLAHLAARPYAPTGRCVLGRESALQKVDWPAGDWPRIPGGVPAEEIPAPTGTSPAAASLAAASPAAASLAAGDVQAEDDHFDAPALGPDWSTLRRPATPDWVDLSVRPSHLRIHGGQSPMARHRPSLVARRVTAPRCTFEATCEFEPRNYRQLAGVTAYYNTRNWYYLHVTADDDGAAVLDVLCCDSGRVTDVGARVALGDVRRVGLRARLDGPALTFAYTLDPGDDAGWRELGRTFDATTLSDEYAATVVAGEPEAWGFTGAFVGLWVQDLGAEGGYADFDRAVYRTD